MSALLVKVALIISVVFGTTGGTVALVEDSLPGSVFYPAKLAMEQTRLEATPDLASQVAMHMTMAQERLREMQQLALEGEPPDEAVMLRLHVHLEKALRLMARLPDSEMQESLTQTLQMLRTQERQMLQTRIRVSGPVQEPLRQATRLLNRLRERVEAALEDSQA
ncbi:MAG TPA: DUF5667 domain-containing protein, partial [Anaerolineae bacterium]|nr:DUF5667 domain-containing protein [Anaerolineae bacterium]